MQPFAAFMGHDVPVISMAELEGSAFTEAHLFGSRPVGWRAVSAIAVEVGRQLRAGEQFVYAYYGGVDKTAHERGFGEFYDAELRFADRLVADIREQLPPGAVLLVTADHGQVEVGRTSSSPTPSCWRWSPSSPARDGSAGGTPAAAAPTSWPRRPPSATSDVAWVVTREQVLDEHWFGPTISPTIASRLGDVALSPTRRSASTTPPTPARSSSCAAMVH